MTASPTLPTLRKAKRLIAAAALASSFLACANPAPENLTDLTLSMSYDEVVAILGGQGEHIHDRGVRVVEWRYSDGSVIESGIHESKISGGNVNEPDGLSGRSDARAAARGLGNEMTELKMRDVLAPEGVTVEDTSDREVLWTFDDGALRATFMRGQLHEAQWSPTEGEPETLIANTDPVGLLIAQLQHERPSDRFRAMQALKDVHEPRVNDALLAVLARETDFAHRGLAAKILADRGDERASDLLLPDLRKQVISDDILDAIGRIGDLTAADVLRAAEENVGSRHTKRKIHAARVKILRGYYGDDWLQHL